MYRTENLVRGTEYLNDLTETRAWELAVISIICEQTAKAGSLKHSRPDYFILTRSGISLFKKALYFFFFAQANLKLNFKTQSRSASFLSRNFQTAEKNTVAFNVKK